MTKTTKPTDEALETLGDIRQEWDEARAEFQEDVEAAVRGAPHIIKKLRLQQEEMTRMAEKIAELEAAYTRTLEAFDFLSFWVVMVVNRLERGNTDGAQRDLKKAIEMSNQMADLE